MKTILTLIYWLAIGIAALASPAFIEKFLTWIAIAIQFLTSI
jgi:hypothetical protein